MDNKTGIEFIDDMNGASFFNSATTTVSRLLIIFTFLGVLFALYNRVQQIDINTKALTSAEINVKELMNNKEDKIEHNHDVQLLRNDIKELRQLILRK